MSKLNELPAKPANQTEADERLSAYMDSWRSGLLSAEPADRPAAEAAIKGLYHNVGKQSPQIIWVASPLVGALACQSIGARFGSLTSPYAKGEVGTGANREFNGLRDPFGFPTYVERAMPERIRRHASFEQASSLERTRDAARRTTEALRLELSRQIPQLVDRYIPSKPGRVDLDGPLGELLLGSSAEPFARLVGRDIFSMMAGLAVRQAFVEEMRSGWPARVIQAMQPGQFDADTLHWSAIESVFGRPFFSPESGAAAHHERLELRLKVAQAAGPWWALDGLALVSERPLLVAHDDQGRLHSEHGPALAFGDGFTIHAWHGVAVDSKVIETPEGITIKTIDAEDNAERRRVLVERFGLDRLVREGNCKLRHEDETGRLWERPMGKVDWWRKDESLVMVEVLNSTPEQDGSRKTYFLRVPPATKTAREGVAWTFGLGAEGYLPALET